ncbi:MAG: GNAT family N-acetyltransferase [Enhydrobacter sp.]|nr:MAG: GNAT family N-acetyltransferase [Enhydrobacter sp.]
MQLVVPAPEHLEAYADALRRGWSPDNVRLEAAAREELARIAHDPVGFLLGMDDRQARGGPITLPDGRQVPRLPGYRRWMWDGTFCGSIGLRWQPGTDALPSYVLGHIGYAVVPWKRRRGYATRALALMMVEARREGLSSVELTTDPDNEVSQKVILANGGAFIERFHAALYGKDELRFRIPL